MTIDTLRLPLSLTFLCPKGLSSRRKISLLVRIGSPVYVYICLYVNNKLYIYLSNYTSSSSSYSYPTLSGLDTTCIFHSTLHSIFSRYLIMLNIESIICRQLYQDTLPGALSPGGCQRFNIERDTYTFAEVGVSLLVHKANWKLVALRGHAFTVKGLK